MQPVTAAGRLFKYIQSLSWIVIHLPQLSFNLKYPPCTNFIQYCKPSTTAAGTRDYTWSWYLLENMLEESIPPTPRNKILLMLMPILLTEDHPWRNNEKIINPILSIHNLPFPPSPKARTDSATQVSHNSSMWVNSFTTEKINMDTEIPHPICLHTNI